jgi:Na+-driven multidrug efflux pump
MLLMTAREEYTMRRERVLKIVLVLVGLLFCAAVYPLMLMAKQDPALAMMMSLYATLGVFLLLASRSPPVPQDVHQHRATGSADT